MKHGTCKFGQACKFHHPPANFPGQHLLGRKNDATPPLVLNAVGPDPSGQGIVYHFLPQRPDEPDCIYFLKNGRCKYGVNCRYHHPILPKNQRPKVAETRRSPELYGRGTQVQYITQIVHPYAISGQQQVVVDKQNPMTYIATVDGNVGQSYQVIQGSDGVTSYCIPTGSVAVTEQGSSTSSIASSSYDTAAEFLGDPYWSRVNRSGSGGSLSAYAERQSQQHSYLQHSVSEGNITAQRRSRSISYGSQSDQSSVYRDATNSPSIPRNSSSGSWQAYRQEVVNRTPPTANVQRWLMPRRSLRGAPEDHGFAMMTTSLLHMLDTPEEVAAESYSDEEYRQHEQYPQTQQVDLAMFERMSLQDNRVQSSAHSREAPSYVDPNMFRELSLHGQNQLSPPSATQAHHSWSPTWQNSHNHGQQDGHSLPIIHQTHAPAPSTTPDSDVGLYLP
jgi:translation initiation factor 4G